MGHHLVNLYLKQFGDNQGPHSLGKHQRQPYSETTGAQR